MTPKSKRYKHHVKLEEIGDYFHFTCKGCARNCTIRVVNTSGTPTECPYGIPCFEWEDVPGNIPSLDFFSTKGDLEYDH